MLGRDDEYDGDAAVERVQPNGVLITRADRKIKISRELITLGMDSDRLIVNGDVVLLIGDNRTVQYRLSQSQQSRDHGYWLADLICEP